VARLKHEWDVDVADPEELVREVQDSRITADILTFVQQLPESRPKFDLQFEWDNVAALPIRSYDYWLERQLHRNPRNKLKRSQKEGLVVRTVEFNDELIRGIKRIQDEVPIRQGRPYIHYRKSLDQVRRGYESFLPRARFAGAFYRDQMVGFLKLVVAKGFTRTMGILTTIEHRNLAPMNALIAKAVEICANEGHSYLVYAKYDYGKVGSDTLTEFKFYHGFEHILLPRYYVPLSMRGSAALKLRLHHGPLSWVPRFCVRALRRAKIAYYEVLSKHALGT
jgi:hypothetical protein